jgi:hypothetical protein
MLIILIILPVVLSYLQILVFDFDFDLFLIVVPFLGVLSYSICFSID